ncbi:hypothetical protein CLV98_105167 [Dyadobacter jejuensis]|uniref:Glycosyl hydrolase family 39 n=2 Tax=Dyadobacter jejuensis TaxID=1082580 RepID=A0A316B5R8_9BACT|nr:hypothetical protein CLV98_105167 [Dyadobacter jejuensis]
MVTLGLLNSAFCFGQAVVKADFTTQKSIGGISSLDRNAYFNLHQGIPNSEFTDAEWNYLTKELKIGLGGRSFSGVGGLGADLKQLPDEKTMKKAGALQIAKFNSSQIPTQPYQLIATEHPKLVFSTKVDLEKLTDYTTHYFKYYYGGEKPLPQYYEPMNEPFVHAREFDKDNDAVIERMSEYHALLAKKLHQQVPGLKVVGYSSAWPEYDLNDFGIWESRMKKFMDIAGQDMDYLSIHLYDGMNLEGDIAKRSGSNSEAILDLIETYSQLKWGKVKPMLISEFGITGKGWSDRYMETRNPLTVNSMHNLVMGFIDRPDVIKLSIPFITGKSKWRLSGGNKTPYQWCISRPSQTDASGWEFTSLTQFYDFWKNVQGDRVEVQSSDPDIAVQAFIADGQGFLVLKNLEEEATEIELSTQLGKMKIKGIVQKTWYINPDSSVVYRTEKLKKLPTSLTMPKEGAMIFEIQYSGKPSAVVAKTMEHRKFYADQYILPIAKSTPVLFNINQVADRAEVATLRLSLSRKPGASLKPTVKFNGARLQVPEDWAGYDQAGRHDYFGTLYLEVDGSLIKKQNEVEIQFDDADGGRVSSVVLETSTIRKP